MLVNTDTCRQVASETYLSILKVRGDTIKLGTHDEAQTISKTHSVRILCQDLDTQQSGGTSNIKVFVMGEDGSVTDKGGFQNQQQPGHLIKTTDLAIFMTAPMARTRKASYAINLGLSKLSTSLEDLHHSDEDCRKVGTAYIYLDPQFSTQGVQRMQIIGTHSKMPIGQIQVEYLIVTNPAAYGISAPLPNWISRVAQLDAGHRGAGSGCRADLPGSITENTIASFNYAARHGADMCELDVMCTADGVPVVYHNYILDTTNQSPTQTIQIDQLTLDELRNFKTAGIHDKNCKHNKEITKVNESSLSKSSQPFPTLVEVLNDVDRSCALNIELKWPQLLPNGKSEATHYREINDNVDRILNCIYEHSNGRHILLSTLNADIAMMLRLKQLQYPVLFLTTGDSQRFNDPTTKTIKGAIHFARAFDMAGINPNAAKLTEYLVRYAQDRGLLVYAWGKIETAQAIRELRRTGLNGVIYDKIDLIKPQD